VQRRRDGAWHELFVETRAEVSEPALQTPEAFVAAVMRDATRANLLRDLELHFDWPKTDLSAFLGDPLHVAIVEAATRGLPDATVGYPIHYFDFMRGVVPLLVPGGAILTNDYGSCDRERLGGIFDRRPQQYGNSFAQDVNFTLFDAFAEVSGWDLVRSDDELESLHSALVTPGRFGSATRAAFAHRGTWGRSDADHLLDFHAAARVFRDRKEPGRALRFFLRCAELDPQNTEYRHLTADVALELGQPRLAFEHLMKGYALEPLRFDWEFMLGRATCLLKDYAAAIAWYERSLAREPHPVTYTNLGSVLEHEGRFADAYHCFHKALALDPKYDRANDRMKHLRDRVWEQAVAGFGPTSPPMARPTQTPSEQANEQSTEKPSEKTGG
jgi:tetratricopeptide (TPR) repeat protein